MYLYLCNTWAKLTCKQHNIPAFATWNENESKLNSFQKESIYLRNKGKGEEFSFNYSGISICFLVNNIIGHIIDHKIIEGQRNYTFLM